MSNLLHEKVLLAGPRAWNAWRLENPSFVPELNDLKVSVSERQFGRAHGGPIDLSRAELCRAELDQATLIEANLTGAVLIDADLSDARLDKADLCGANLSNARLAYASFNHARLEATILEGADLRYARGLTQAQIDQARGDYSTILPAGLAMPGAWLPEDQTEPAQLAKQPPAEIGAPTVDPFAALGLSHGASMQDVRAAWRKLVKQLHPDGGADESPATERLKAINQAYQRLKNLERGATQRHAAVRAFHGARVVFAVSFLLPIAATALLLAARTYFAHPDDAIREETTAAAVTTSVEESEQEPAPHRSISYATSGPASVDEPAVAAAERLR